MQIITGRIAAAIKTVIYGPEGIGKSTLAAQFPNALFIDTEGSTTHMDVRRLPPPASWTELLEEVDWVYRCRDEAFPAGAPGTLVLDTADWAEMYCAEHVCARAQKTGVEDFGYGKGYTYVMEEFGRLLDKLENVRKKDVHIVITAHAKMRKFEQPDELGAYDRWEMKLSKQVAPMVKEWADMALFASYKTFVVNVDGQGAAKGRNKVQGGARVLRCTHNPCWDAKNRFGLPDELPMEYAQIRHVIEGSVQAAPGSVKAEAPAPTPAKPPVSEAAPAPAAPAPEQPTEAAAEGGEWAGIPDALRNLMREHDVKPQEIAYAVAQKGYYPMNTPIANYDPGFVQGVLIGAWSQVWGMIQDDRKNMPF